MYRAEDRSCTLQQIVSWRVHDNAPEWAQPAIDYGVYLDYKRNPRCGMALSVPDLHEAVRAVLPAFKAKFPVLGDLHITGSWVNGGWCYPGDVDQAHLDVREKFGKPAVSDLDFWTLYTPEQEARERLWAVAERLNWKADWVSWWGPALPVDGGKIRACNHNDRLSGEWKRRIKHAIKEMS